MVISINSMAIQSPAFDLDSLIYDFCYTNALREAGINSIGEGLDTAIKNIIKEYIFDILDNKTTNPMEVISQIQETTELYSSKQLSFGKIQLLLNSTVKYIFIIRFKDSYKGFGGRGTFEVCHCPIDITVLTALARSVNMGLLDYSKWNDELKNRGIHRASVSTMLKNIKPDEITTEEYLLCQDMIASYVESCNEIECAIEFSYL